MLKRRSKLLKLPPEILEQVNLMLDEGATYQSILDFLGAQGFSDINMDNLYLWKEGGFQDWRNEQKQRFHEQQLLAWSLRAAQHNSPGILASAVLHYGSAKLYEAINQSDPAALRDGLQQKPEVLAQFLQALAWIAKEAVQLQRVQNEAARAEKAVAAADEKTLPAPPESVEEAVRRLHLH